MEVLTSAGSGAHSGAQFLQFSGDRMKFLDQYHDAVEIHANEESVGVTDFTNYATRYTITDFHH